MRKEGCIRSSSPLPLSCVTLLYHTFLLLSGITLNNPYASGPPTTSPGLLVPEDVHGSLLHLHELHAACTGEVSVVRSCVSGEQPPPLLGDIWGSLDSEPGGTIKHCNVSTADGT